MLRKIYEIELWNKLWEPRFNNMFHEESTINKNTTEMLGSILFVLIRPFQTTQQCPKTGRMQCCLTQNVHWTNEKKIKNLSLFPTSESLSKALWKTLYSSSRSSMWSFSCSTTRGLHLCLLLYLLRCLIHALPYGLPRDYLGLHRCSWIINSVYLPFLFRKFRDFGWTDYV